MVVPCLSQRPVLQYPGAPVELSSEKVSSGVKQEGPGGGEKGAVGNTGEQVRKSPTMLFLQKQIWNPSFRSPQELTMQSPGLWLGHMMEMAESPLELALSPGFPGFLRAPCITGQLQQMEHGTQSGHLAASDPRSNSHSSPACSSLGTLSRTAGGGAGVGKTPTHCFSLFLQCWG